MAALGASLSIISYIATCKNSLLPSPPVKPQPPSPPPTFPSLPPQPHHKPTPGVVSAVSACDYLAKIVPVNPLLAAILLLVAFAALTLCGMRESATIAFAIWIVHILTLAVLALGCLAYAASEGFGILLLNKDEPLPALRMADTDVSASVAASLFLGFSSAMLGVSGYETTAQVINFGSTD